MKNQTFGDVLQSILDEKGITSAKLAADTGIQKSTLSRLLNNQRGSIRFPDLIKIADYFNVSTDRLLGREGE